MTIISLFRCLKAVCSWHGGCEKEVMMHYTDKKRSSLCHLITDFHSASQRRLARFDFWGVTLSGVMILTMLGVMRLLVSH